MFIYLKDMHVDNYIYSTYNTPHTYTQSNEHQLLYKGMDKSYISFPSMQQTQRTNQKLQKKDLFSLWVQEWISFRDD